METLSQILTGLFARYPQMQIEDLYKLLHQSALGSEHAVRDGQAARDWMERELAEMGTGPDDPLLDPLSPDGQIVRVHLRPYLLAGKNPETLLEAFIRTANDWHGSVDKLKEYGAAAAQLALAGTGAIQAEVIEAFFANMAAHDYPAMHHSKSYENLYRPAYRVVARKFLEEK
jgi:hypothetical protein